MTADSDYARVVELLTKQTLASYVSYQATDRVSGIARHDEQNRIVVRVRDGKIVSGNSHSDFDTHTKIDDEDTNPVTRPVFDPKCYRATGESESTYNDAPAIAIALAPICDSDHDTKFTTLYAEPHSLRPLDVQGGVSTEDASKYVKVTLDQAFAVFNGRTMPVALHVDVSGSGLMFWLQVHVTEDYSDYKFLNSYAL